MAPEATEAFNGTIELDIRDSEPDWGPYAAPVAPEHSPNILYLVWDDVGIATWDCFGGLVEMPAMTRVAERGVRLSQFHTTALCSPTRASLLTGRNATTVGMATIEEFTDGFPNCNGRIPADTALLPEVLASMAMVAAAQPYLAWLTYTAEAAAHAGSQAMASAAAYEAAYAMTVPPEVVAANRALLAALVATNVLGINTPAIMATEALYAEMWAQDALAMYGYAAASGAAGMLQPLSPPSQTTNPGGLAAQSAAVGSAAATAAVNQVSVADLISSLPNAVSGLASPVTSVLDSTGLSGIIADIDALLATPFVANIINSAVNTAAWYVNAAIPTAIFLANALNSGAPVAIAEGAIEAAEGAASAAAAGLADSVTPAGLGASLGEATLVGRLSVPAAWSTAAPATTAGATALEGSGWTVAAEEAGPVTGMMPGMASAAKGTGAYAGPRYGFKPTVMPKQVVV